MGLTSEARIPTFSSFSLWCGIGSLYHCCCCLVFPADWSLSLVSGKRSAGAKESQNKLTRRQSLPLSLCKQWRAAGERRLHWCGCLSHVQGTPSRRLLGFDHTSRAFRWCGYPRHPCSGKEPLTCVLVSNSNKLLIHEGGLWGEFSFICFPFPNWGD